MEAQKETRQGNGGALVEVQRLKKYFPLQESLILSKVSGSVRAVDDVSFMIEKGETLGLVGESGCGKSTTGRVILALHQPTDGKVFFRGREIFSLSAAELRGLRREMQIIFQDPYASLNPRMTVSEIVEEPLKIHRLAKGKELKGQVDELLTLVGLDSRYSSRYPHEFSGGQRQRIGIARAISLHPSFIVCDEPVSALDVSIQAQIINLLEDLQEKFSLTYLFIAHDLSVVRHISDRIAVMYLGKIVEVAESAFLYESPLHPYTRALLAAIPVPDPEGKKREEKGAASLIPGDPPSPLNPPSGCRFHTRCPIMDPTICPLREPELREITRGHFAACHKV